MDFTLLRFWISMTIVRSETPVLCNLDALLANATWSSFTVSWLVTDKRVRSGQVHYSYLTSSLLRI